MYEKSQVSRQIQSVLGDMQYLTRLLYVVKDPQTRNLALQQLWNQISYLQFLTGLPSASVAAAAPAPAAPPAVAAPAPQQAGEQAPARTFTREQLATYTGRNGNPAYVAVNGTVYDVTNNKAWSAASHFGLPAGKDLTAEFASCHAAQQWILTTLRPVGRLA
ncbi:MAG TPA: cytochrome b5 domain-containing protein [Symbiobacteriaceae bacterium]|nr:cytochrome b5 domain-containing protein [Symbiobacteriaceae bacterium]